LAKQSSFIPGDPRVEEPYRLTPQAALRVAVLGSIALLIFGALFLRLWALEILSGHQYLRVAQDNQLRTVRLAAPRGPILDRNGRVLVANVAGTAVQLRPADLPKTWRARKHELQLLSRIVHTPVSEMLAGIEARKGDPLTPVTVKEGIHRDQYYYLSEHKDQFPGLQLTDSFIRQYPYGATASQLLGYVAEISAQQLKHAKPGYRAGDKIGQTGIEAAFDGYLRGQSGQSKLRVDSLGNPRGQLTPSNLPRSGSAIRLTIDVRLQRAAQQALEIGMERAKASNCYGCWDANGGAVVALDPKDGSVLALASAPTFNPSVFSGRVTTKRLAAQGLTQATATTANYPSLNRAIDGQYPPGSTFKPVTALAAMQEHLIQPWSTLPCTGSYVSPNDKSVPKQVFSNWDPGVNTAMDLPTALAYSCDTYFYQLGDRFFALPPERSHPLQAWAQRFGFGRTTGLEVGPEASGLLPTPEWRLKKYTRKTDRCCWQVDSLWKPGDSIQLAIGQKDLLVTPLQMARFYAMLANGGKLVTPHVLLGIQPQGSGGAAPHPQALAPQPINVDPSALEVVREGLLEATHASFGTSTAVFGNFPVPIAGKTGTAEKSVDPGDGIMRTFNQAWWCGYGPADNAKIVVCAVIENGGHGGEAAAPAALKVFEQFFHKSTTLNGAIHSD
jgi:penicillin-binding protein 2